MKLKDKLKRYASNDFYEDNFAKIIILILLLFLVNILISC